MRRIFSWEGLLIVLLVGLHLFVFARGMGGNDGWSYLGNTVSLVEDQDLDLANNRVTFPEAPKYEYDVLDRPPYSPDAMPGAETPADMRRPGPPPEHAPTGSPRRGAGAPGATPALAARPGSADVPRQRDAGRTDLPPGAVPPGPPTPEARQGRPSTPPSREATPPGRPPHEPPASARPGERVPVSGPTDAPRRLDPISGAPLADPVASQPTEAQDGPPPIGYGYRPPDPYMESPVHKDRFVTHEPLGTSFFDFPFVFAATKIVGERDFSLNIGHPDYRDLSGRQTAQVVAVIVSHSFWTLLAMLLLYATMLKLDYTRGDSLMATLLVFFSSSITWYGPSGFSHPVSVFMTAVIVYAFVSLLTRMQEDDSRGYYLRILFLGLASGLAGVVRYPNAIIGGMLFLYLLFERQSWGKRFGRLAVFLVGFAALWWINHYYWYLQFGEFLTPHGMRLLVFNQRSFLAPVKTLLHPNGGLFLFSPLFLFGLFGLLMFLANRRIAPIESRVAKVALLSTILLATLYGLHGEYHGGGFGNRFLTNCGILLGIGVIELLGGEDHRIMRYLIALAAATWSYLVFLIGHSRAVGGTYSVSQNIRTYWNALGNEWSRERIWPALRTSSHTINYLIVPERRILLIAIAVGVGVLFVVALIGSFRHMGSWRYEKVAKNKGGDPSARWRA